MAKRITEQWLSLFETHEQSGLSQSQFCKEQGLRSKHFSLHKRQLLGDEKPSPFVGVQQARSTTLNTPQVEWQLQMGEVRLRVLNVPVEQMAHLLKALA